MSRSEEYHGNLPSMTATMSDWLEMLQNEPTMTHFREWIEKNCVSPIIVFDFQNLCHWPWGPDAFIDIKCAIPPSRGARLYELQPVVRELQSSLEMEIASFRKMCESVYQHIGVKASSQYKRGVVNRFLSALLINLASCAKHVLQSNSAVDESFNKLFVGMWHMPEEMKGVFDQVESMAFSRFGGDDGAAFDSEDKSFNDLVHLSTMLAFMANGHYSIAKRYRYRCLFLATVNQCICMSSDPETNNVPPYTSSLMIAGCQINPTMRKLILEKTCVGMEAKVRQKHLDDMNKLQSLNELVIVHTAIKSLASHLSLSERANLVHQIATHHVSDLFGQ